MKRLFFAIILAIVLMTTFAVPVQAYTYWWSGNSRTSAYGVKANITVPDSAPTLYSGHIAGWVGTESYNNNWVETGWGIVYGYAPWSFTEYSMNGGSDHYTNWISQLSYGDDSEYQVYYIGNYWYCYINGVFKMVCGYGGLPTPPHKMLGWAEVEGSSSNELDTCLYDVSWRNSSGTWYTFDQANWREDSPYYIYYSSYNDYYCIGP